MMGCFVMSKEQLFSATCLSASLRNPSSRRQTTRAQAGLSPAKELKALCPGRSQPRLPTSPRSPGPARTKARSGCRVPLEGGLLGGQGYQSVAGIEAVEPLGTVERRTAARGAPPLVGILI